MSPLQPQRTHFLAPYLVLEHRQLFPYRLVNMKTPYERAELKKVSVELDPSIFN